MNKVLLAGRLTRDPETRTLASGKNVTQFGVATHDYRSGGQERSEYHSIVAWDRLAEIAGRYLGKGQQVALEGRLQTRTWDDDQGKRHWRTEIVATHIEMLGGRKKKDYDAETAAHALEAQAAAIGAAPVHGSADDLAADGFLASDDEPDPAGEPQAEEDLVSETAA